MGSVRSFAPEKLVIAALLSQATLLEPVRAAVEQALGTVDTVRPPEPYTWTRYYEAEMGAGIVRSIFSLERLVDPSQLARIKACTNEIETRHREGGRRRANLDPGLLSYSRFILASTKDSAHRIPLEGGIYAEITLVWERGAWRPVEWTYPDWASPGYREHLALIRERYVAARTSAPAP